MLNLLILFIILGALVTATAWLERRHPLDPNYLDELQSSIDRHPAGKGRRGR